MRPSQTIKKELKKLFPSVKFSCTYDSFSMGDAVCVDRVGGPTKDEIRKVLAKYVYGDYDCMTDCYEYSNVKDISTQVKYLRLCRD